MLQQWLEREACLVLSWTWVGRYSLLQGLYVAAMARKRGMSCVLLGWGWEVFMVTRHVVKIVRKRGMSCGELDWDWEIFTVPRHVAM